MLRYTGHWDGSNWAALLTWGSVQIPLLMPSVILEVSICRVNIWFVLVSLPISEITSDLWNWSCEKIAFESLANVRYIYLKNGLVKT